MITVLMLTSSYPRYESDNSSPFLKHLTKHLRDRAIDVHILAPAPTDEARIRDRKLHYFRYFIQPWQKLAYGSGILPNLGKNPLLWLLVPFFLASMFGKLIIVAKRLKPDIIHAHWILPQGLIALLSKIILGKPVIVTAHGADAYAYQSFPLAWLKKLTLSYCDSWTANTQATADAAWPEAKDNKPVVIPMGVDVSHFSSGSREFLRTNIDSRKIVLFVGRLVDKKGVDDLLRAFAKLPNSTRLSTRLWIIGDGNNKPALEQLASRLGITESIRFWGQVPNDELPHYYAAADLFVCPSIADKSGDTEGQGVVLIEAFASRLCVVATRIGGIPEVVDTGKTGILVSSGSIDELSTTIDQLLADDKKRALLANNAYEVASQKYDWNKVSEQFHELYKDVLSRPDMANKATSH